MLIKKVLSKLLANKSIKALGYSKKELRGIAQQIADNLNSTEETSEEEVDAEIDERIEAVTPFLGFGQSQANRLLDEWKKNNPTPMDDDEDGKGDDDFNDYLADVELDIKALNQERADKGLELLGKPATQREQETTKTKPYSEAEAKEIFG
jgi:Holliday junction resolvasome RuvABC DNA-binding subunit